MHTKGEKAMIKIGELSNITNISIQTIRYYESEGLIKPIEVDRWTNYRYYDQSSIERLCEIKYLKDLGFSLKEIKNLNDETIKEKISQIKLDIKKLTKNMQKLSTIRKERGCVKVNMFINDEKVIGKWNKIGIVKNKEDYNNNKFDEEFIFDYKELYFLPNGEQYWVFSWTKGTLYLNDRELPYEIIDDKLFIGVRDFITNEIDNYAIYEKIDSKYYTKDEIKIEDNTNIAFENDEQIIGFWESVDCIEEINQFNPNKPYRNEELYLQKYIIEPNGNLYEKFSDDEEIISINWTKNYIINNHNKTASKYIIKTIDDNDYMFVEWKSGDYQFGGKVSVYYVLKKINDLVKKH